MKECPHKKQNLLWPSELRIYVSFSKNSAELKFPWRIMFCLLSVAFFNNKLLYKFQTYITVSNDDL